MYTKYKDDLLKKINKIENKNSVTIGETRIYNIWSCMKQRCYNTKNKNYNLYGGRGIKMSDEWVNSFENFCRDMLPTYKYNLTIDRRNNNSNYCKENCKWLKANYQQKNRRPFSEWDSKYNKNS